MLRGNRRLAPAVVLSCGAMSVAVKARVVNGYLVVNEPTDLPEGTELELVSVDADESPEERAEIEAAIDESLDEFEAGKIVDDKTIRTMIRAYR